MHIGQVSTHKLACAAEPYETFQYGIRRIVDGAYAIGIDIFHQIADRPGISGYAAAVCFQYLCVVVFPGQRFEHFDRVNTPFDKVKIVFSLMK